MVALTKFLTPSSSSDLYMHGSEETVSKSIEANVAPPPSSMVVAKLNQIASIFKNVVSVRNRLVQ